MKNIVIVLKSGVQIETKYNWEEIKRDLNENPNDGEVTLPQVDGKWCCVTKEEIAAYLNIA